MAKTTSLSVDCRTTKELFGPVVGSGLNVGLDTFGHGFLVYAEGYKHAGDTLVQSLRRSDKQVLVFSVCYLYRHYLELMIKGLTRLANSILDGRSDYRPSHPLETLWRECMPLLEKAMLRYSRKASAVWENALRASRPSILKVNSSATQKTRIAVLGRSPWGT